MTKRTSREVGSAMDTRPSRHLRCRRFSACAAR
eukprot:CAMPEP_0117583470 /NCGR_PEP_ID=MMETSP0784-20121206/67038_1 /TAXON_ID=39447 /ORGANISM="" /LENGTH=32 /DNA_ID= /DNA_START= /DNA_END= /DNA_ORIENTATION=